MDCIERKFPISQKAVTEWCVHRWTGENDSQAIDSQKPFTKLTHKSHYKSDGFSKWAQGKRAWKTVAFLPLYTLHRLLR